jgi:hypothetical protein
MAYATPERRTAFASVRDLEALERFPLLSLLFCELFLACHWELSSVPNSFLSSLNIPAALLGLFWHWMRLPVERKQFLRVFL